MRNQSIISQKENRIPLDRRLSLKFSSAANCKNNPRMSIPLRRESMMSACSQQVSSFNMHNDMGRDYRPSLVSNASSTSISRQSKKSAILSNLVRKLDHEEQLKQIIQSKIKNSDCVEYTEGNFSNEHLECTIRQYQREVECFKDIIAELVEKINVLEGHSHGRSGVESGSFMKKIRKQCGVQTEQESSEFRVHTVATRYENIDGSFDFIDNLDRTLRVLSGKKSR